MWIALKDCSNWRSSGTSSSSVIVIVAHMMVCALEHRVDEDLMADSDIVAAILAGYANDPWFAEEANIAKEDLRFENGTSSKDAAFAAVRAGILQELHDSNYAGHVGIHRTVLNVKRMCGGLTW